MELNKQPKKFSFLKQYFWDIDWNNFQPEKYSDFTIERILEKGNKKAIDWLKKNFSATKIKKVIKQSRYISNKSANYWGIIYNIESKNIKCLQKQFQKTQKTAWRS